VCERSKDPVEFIPMKDFYLKQLDFLSDLRKLQKEVEFLPEHHRQILTSWMDGVTIDWPISRRRFYGTEIPIWWCKKCGEANLPEKGKYCQPWKDAPPFKECKKCGGTEFTGEEKTFDTWMDSSISPLFISRYSKDIEFFGKTYPTAIRPQAKDIVRTWLFYTLLRCYQLTSKAPWERAWIMGYGLDEKGEKMSKSKGNVIDPIPILEKHGADAFRFWAASETSLGSDFRCSEDRISSATKFLTKLWNISRFISMFPEPREFDTALLAETDKWILSELEKLKAECMEGYRGFNFFVPATKVRDFVWNVFAAHYIEMVKKRAYGEGFGEEEKNSAVYTLHLVLKEVAMLLAPVMPFETDYIFRGLYCDRVHDKEFPESRDIEPVDGSKILEFNESVWKEKKEKGLSLRSGIKIDIPDGLKPFEKDLISMHNIET
jgi:valyl-tRNA synthetase